MKISVKLTAVVLSRAVLVTAVLATAILAAGTGWAEVVPGDVIDKSNYQKIEGLVPDYIVKWVKEGDLTMKIGKLTYDPEKFLRPEFKEKTNTGRYKIGENNILIDLKTGKKNPHPTEVRGFPFPEPDINDPTIPAQLLHNFNQTDFITFPTHQIQFWYGINRRGIEKTYEVENQLMVFDPKDKYDHGIISVFKKPFEMSGTGSLALYHMDPLKRGIRYLYVPSLGRIKRMSHRLAGSETPLNSLVAGPDDFWAGGPRTAYEEGKYTFIKEKDGLVPYYTSRPGKAVKNEKGEIFLGYAKTGEKIILGCETPEWNGAPWHTPETVWIKEKVYVIESISTNSNYRYGPCQGWVAKKTFLPVYKRITDINGELWKGCYLNIRGYETQDSSFRTIEDRTALVIVDLKRDHGCVYIHGRREGAFYSEHKKGMNKALFTRAGFVKFTR